jgi:transaldolase/glucose-6-phosphate isomerase
VIADLKAIGIPMVQVTKELEDEGVANFAKSYETLGEAIAAKRDALLAGQQQNEQTDVGEYKTDVEKTLASLQDAGSHIWNKDGGWWTDDPAVQAHIVDRLGWLDVVDRMIGEADDLRAFADEVRKARFDKVLLMGMGGSSLAPDLFSMEFETADGFPELYVLDSTDPAVVALCRQELDPKTTLYIVSSKSGTTTEPNAFMEYFYERVKQVKGDKAGENFVAITDPGSPLIAEAQQRGFRKIYQNPPDIGGRYSALSYFGLVPAALMGIDVRKLLERAHLMAERCGKGVPAQSNPGVWLGAVLGTLAQRGRDKVTFVTTLGTDSFADWAEQLIAESTGKQGKGLVPIAREELGAPEVYGDDRVFIYMPKEGDDTADYDEAIEALMDAGHPVITLPLQDEYDLAGEFFRWEIAVAVAGKVLGINPFDEPNVTESKNNTKRLLEEYGRKKRLP